MIVQTLFHQNAKLVLGQVEVKLLPGIPQLHIVGLPDASIKECGIKLKSALRSLGLEWPAGQQIVVSLRPMDVRKGGSGADMAIALAYMALTDQLSKAMREVLETHVVYGEVALDGSLHAPPDLGRALQTAKDRPILTGAAQSEVREGQWWELSTLSQTNPKFRSRTFDWEGFWRRPPLPDIRLNAKAAQVLLLAKHMKLNVLLAGPQGSGKTTWARLLHALSDPPDSREMTELSHHFGEEVFESRWLPLEQPHHTITTLAMIGGGLPLQPGVITRAHGGLLVMDEFLQFHPQVIEALREPIESGFAELARQGTREKYPARFQLISTTNLCPCGKLDPDDLRRRCLENIHRCRSTIFRLSGPILDRFDVLTLSHEWLNGGESMKTSDLLTELEELKNFAASRKDEAAETPWVGELGLSHRRRRSIHRVARGLADLERSVQVTGQHTQKAFEIVVTPMLKLRELFA